MKNQCILTSLMYAAMLGISANLCAENLSTENIQRQKATSKYQAYLPAK